MTKEQLLEKLKKWRLFYFSCTMCARADQAQELGSILEEAAKYVEKIVFCKNCWKKGNPAECPMCRKEIDIDFHSTVEYIVDETREYGFCDQGEKKKNQNAKNKS